MNRSLWKFLTSLRLTIVLLILAILIIFFGTIAQVDDGLYAAQSHWFRSYVVYGVGHPHFETWHWWQTLFTKLGLQIPVLHLYLPWALPGGYTAGVALLVNLVAAHIKRFQWSSSKIGIHLTHLGIITLLVGQLTADKLQKESRMVFNEGESGNYIERHREYELAITSDTGKNDEQVVAIPQALVVKGHDITNPSLPFTVRVKDYGPNSEVVFHQKALQAVVTQTTALATLDSEFSTVDGIVPQAERAEEMPGRVEVWRAALKAVGETDVENVVAAAKRVAAQPDKEGKLRTELKTRFRSEMLQRFSNMPDREDPETARAMRYVAKKIRDGETVTQETLTPASSEGAGTRATLVPLKEFTDMDARNFPYAVLEFIGADGKSLGTWLTTPILREQPVKVGDKTVRVALREERQYLPYSLKLLHATHKVYAGSDIPKDFRSRMQIDNPVTKESRETEISMNDPLRYQGLAFYQYQMTKDEFDRAPGQSVLQVVQNPSWLVPYIGCIVVAAGMLWQFLHHLVGFITKRRSA